MNSEDGKPSVTIIGLLPRQAEQVAAAYGEEADLRFLSVDMAASRIRATTESSDHVILMTKFMPHEVQTAVRKHEGLTYCNGGVSSVNLKLEMLLGNT